MVNCAPSSSASTLSESYSAASSAILNRPLKPLRRRAVSATDLRGETLPTGTDSTIKVIARLRPVDGESVCEVDKSENGKKLVVVRNNQFSFSEVLEESSTQEEVYEIVGRPLLNSFLEGYNVCLMVYGHTNSGKTYSISGDFQHPGVIPRFCQDLWTDVDSNGSVSVSFYEIYQEKVYDLLRADSEGREPLSIRGTSQPFVENLIWVAIENADRLMELLSRGWKKRSTKASLANERSSRSHAVFVIRYTRRKEIEGHERTISSCCYFVDLAGSEKIRNDGVLRQEGVSINQSLTTLRRVVAARAEKNPKDFVNCRDSALTRLLQEAFIGNSRTCVLATLSPSMDQLNETMSTLRFASDASKVKLKPKVNTVDRDNRIDSLEQENIQLRNLVSELQSNTRSALYSDFKPPGIFEVFPDYALNTFTLIAGAEVFGEYDQDTFTVKLVDGEMTLSTISSVYVNGKLTSHHVLQHGDRIVLDGKRFFVAYCEYTNSSNLLNFYRAKNEYVEATFPVIEERLRREARETLKNEIKNEKENLKEVIDDLTEQLHREKKDAAEKRRLAQELENYILLQQNLDQELSNQDSSLHTVSRFVNSKIVEAEVAVSIANDVLESFGKKAIFLFKLELTGGESVLVRLINRKQRITADLTLAEFYGLKEQLSEAYITSTVDGDNLGTVEKLLYSKTFRWNQIDARRSSLFSVAMVNSLRKTAQARNSTIDNIKQSYAHRRSSAIGATQEEGKKEIYEFLNLSFATTLSGRISELTAQGSGTTLLARSLDGVLEAHGRLLSVEKKIVKDQSAIVVVKYDALRVIDGLIGRISGTKEAETDEIVTKILAEMHQNAINLLKTFDSWDYVHQQHSSGNSEGFLQAMKSLIDDLFTSLGKLIFRKEADQPDLKFSEEILQLVENGMRKELNGRREDAEQRVKRVRKMPGKRASLFVILGDAFLCVTKDFMGSPWNFTTANTVLWPLYKLANSLMKVRGNEVPVEMLDRLEQIRENVESGIENDDVVRTLNEQFERFFDMCK
ncbi:hypothetical protein L596_008052 [Steinernema carpocapsae]|uniref:Kinesin motor domain-containing protein n=1 Tax=Steinernema carpocapsae TaxID=34508 RepID=A0A4U5PBD7_STECR|nr:hypothetical protein L596_008052 [Steinernema carpocapsae]